MLKKHDGSEPEALDASDFAFEDWDDFCVGDRREKQCPLYTAFDPPESTYTGAEK
jgi:hypothetical protein